MKKLLLSLLAVYSLTAFSATMPPIDVSFDLDSQPLTQVMKLIYIQALPERPYFLDPALLQDQRIISFRYTHKDGDFRPFFNTFLHELGYTLDVKNGADFIKPTPNTETLSIAEDPSQEIFIYRPKHRDGSYLVEFLSPLFNGKFTQQRTISVPYSPSSSTVSPNVQTTNSITNPQQPASPNSALGQIDRHLDQLIFSGSKKEVVALKKLLDQVDTDIGQVVVSGAVYEVQTGEHHGSAMSLAASLLSGKLDFNFGTAKAADNFVSLKIADMTAIIQALDSDSRFKVLSSPEVRVSSGNTATFTVGEQVPVLGAITYPQGGSAPVQSVDYRSAGVIFSIQPDIHDSAIDVHVDQQVSNFVNTTTGVNNSPTLTTRHLSTNVSMSDGDLIVIGGLRQNKDTFGHSAFPFFPSIFQSTTTDKSNSEILLFLQLKRI